MEQFQFITNCLRELNYPNVNSMNDEEMMAIFSMPNREFFISWVLKQLDKGYEDVLLNYTKEDLADIVCDHGFCTETQKMKFMCGGLDSAEQFKIIYRMLKFTKHVSSEATPVVDGTVSTSTQTITDLREMDVNLFSVFGPQKHLTEQQRRTKIKEYNEEIEHLERLLASTESKPAADTAFLNLNHKNEFMQHLESFAKMLPEFKHKVLEILQLKQIGEKSDIKFDLNYEKLLCQCRENVIRTKKLIEDVYTITNVQENNAPGLIFEDSNARICAMFQELSKLSVDINSIGE